MFDYITGKLVQKTESYAVVEAGGIGYRIFSPLSSLNEMGEVGQNVKLYIYFNIKNTSDILTLYGFTGREERKTFEMILGVSGIGAKTAAALLSNVSASKFALCVVTNDAKYLASHTPGLGPKGAQRIILELKDKFKEVELDNVGAEELFADTGDDTNEALSALVVLGYSKTEAERALAGSDGSVEDRIKYALKKLM
ncbi:MAG: Holliday junction branch migration protein RuvA [Clostridia bacterium]|nr:Holliday junction branch migration protein RuvA [Clostridia bacterium]